MSIAKYVKMSDGSNVKTVVISTERELALYLPEFISGAYKSGLFVGFDTEWMCQYEGFSATPNRAKIALLKLCNNCGFCLLIKLHRLIKMPRDLVGLLAVRDITFVGINISKNLEKLKEDYGLEIRSIVDLTKMAAKRGGFAWYDAWQVSLKGLNFLLDRTQALRPKVVDEELIFWLVNNPWTDFDGDSSDKKLEYAVFSAYAAVKIAKSLFSSASMGCQNTIND